MRRWIVVIAVVAGGCATPQSRLVVDLGLNAVQRPADVAERWGEYRLEPADTSGFTYEDDLVALAVVPLEGSFSTVIENRSEHSVRLLWADGAYVGPDGVSSGILSGDTQWRDFGAVPGPQLIPSRASAAVSVLPRATADPVSMTIGTFYGPGAECPDITGASIRLVLPLEIQGVVNEYTLEFVPRSMEVVTVKVNLSGQEMGEERTPCTAAGAQ